MLLDHTDVRNLSKKYDLHQKIHWDLYVRINGYINSTMGYPREINLETVKTFWTSYEKIDKKTLKNIDCVASYY